VKASIVKVRVFSEAVVTDLEDDVNAFLAGLAEAEFLGIQYQWDGTSYTAMVIYSE
jgi:hypothetical protein